jgi:hypothetical protein
MFEVATLLICGPGPAVLNDHVKLDAIALPARSATPPVPPVIVAVYVALLASAEVGWRTAVFVPLLYVTVAATRLVLESRSWNVLLLIELAVIGSLKVAVTDVLVAPVELAAGLTEVTVGGVVSGPAGTNTTSTQ